VLTRGAKLTPAAIAGAARVGVAEVQVVAPPRVVVLSSGDELVSIDQSPQAAQIRNSNGPMLVALLDHLGADARDAGWMRDDPASIRAAIQSVINDCDVLMLSGGMSMGEYDFIPRVLREMGVELRITKVKIKPGKPFVFGAYSPLAASQIETRGLDSVYRSATPQAAGTFVFGLPGNPVSGFVCTVRFCARLLARLAGGEPAEAEQWVHGPLTESLPANGPREFYQPAILNPDGSIAALQWKGSADIYTLARANAMLVRAENEPPQNAGSIARLLLIPS
jgi:molybdopterin molybdotransferase